MEHVHQVIHARWVVPINPANTVLHDHAVVIHDGRIRALLPSELARGQFQAERSFELGEQLLMPGLVNAHGHAAMTLMRGLADDQPLMRWLQQHIWPAEARWVDAEFVRVGTQLAIAEMLASGTTCFSDMYYFPDVVGLAAAETGMRAQLAFPVLEQPTVWAQDADDYLAKGLQLRNEFKTNPRISIAFGPHAPYTVSNRSLARIAVLSEETEFPVHIHLHETEEEIHGSLSEHGQRPLARLDSLGLLSPRLQAVHMTHLLGEDIDLLARNGVQVIHCPSSNLKLATGICPVGRLLAAGVNVGLGSDGAASNNSLNLFGEMRLAALLAKCDSGDASTLPAHHALRMATQAGADALGLGDRIGSIEVGKEADLIAVNMDRLDCGPLYHPQSALVYTASGAAVSHAWVEGKILLENRQFCRLDGEWLREQMREWHNRITAH